MGTPMSDFDSAGAPLYRASSGQLHRGRTLTDDVPSASLKSNRLPQYTFDPATLISQSIETQLHGLYDRPAFDTNPTRHCQQGTSFARSRCGNYAVRNTSQRTSLPAGVNVLSCDPGFVNVLRSSGLQSRRSGSSSAGVAAAAKTTTSLPSPSALLRSPYASSMVLRSGVPPHGGRWSRQQRKEELIENGLEPLQNLVGLDNYFVDRLSSSYHTLSSDNSPDTEMTSCDYRAASSRNGVHREVTKVVPSAPFQNSLGSLPTAPGRQVGQPAASTAVSVSRSRPAMSLATAQATLDEMTVSSANASEAVTASSSVPIPAQTRSSTQLPDSTATTGVSKERDVRCSSSSSSTSTHTSSSSGTSTNTSDSEDEIFFDEDPLCSHLVTSSTNMPVRPTQQLMPPAQRQRNTMRNGSVNKARVPTSQEAIQPVKTMKSHRALPNVLDARALSSPTSNAMPSAAVSISTLNGVSHGSANASVTSTVGTQAAHPLSSLPPPPRPNLTVAVELDKLSQNARRRSIDVLLDHLLQLRVQHQSSSHTMTKYPSLTAVKTSATPFSTAKRGTSARRACDSVRSRHFAASRGRQSTASQSRRRQPNQQQQPLHNSLYSVREEKACSGGGDDVYVRLSRRCECCAMPLPQEVVRPQPPPPRAEAASDPHRPRRSRRQPNAATQQEASPYSLPLPGASRPQHSYEASQLNVYAAESLSYRPPQYGEMHFSDEKEENVEAAGENAGEQKSMQNGSTIQKNRCYQRRYNQPRLQQQQQRHCMLSGTIERALKHHTAELDDKVGANISAYISEVVQEYIQGLQLQAQQQKEEVLRRSTDGDEDGKGDGCGNSELSGDDACAQKTLPGEAAMDDTLAAELLRSLVDEGHAQRLMSPYTQPQEHVILTTTTTQMQQQLPSYSSRLPYSSSFFSRPNPYATNDPLYPYNIPHPPRRDDSMETVLDTAGETSGTTVEIKAQTESAAAGVESTTQQQSKTMRMQHQSVVEEDEQGDFSHDAKEAKENETLHTPLVSSPRPSRAVIDRSVQTSLPGSRRESVSAGEAEKSSDVQVMPAPPATLADKDGASEVETVRREEKPLALPLPNMDKDDSSKEPLPPASTSRTSLSSLVPSALAAMTPSVSLPSPEEVEPQTTTPMPQLQHSNAVAKASETMSAAAVAAHEIEEAALHTTETGVRVALHQSVLQAQLELLVGMEATLRSCLSSDEMEARRDIAFAHVHQFEMADRWCISNTEKKERSLLQRSSRYGRDRILVTELVLKEWARALEVEQAAWVQIVVDAATEVATLQRLPEGKAQVKERIEELLYDEARLRRSIRLTESLMSQELQVSICEYEESYVREDLDYAELVEWLEVQRTFLLTAPRRASRSSLPAGGAVHNAHDMMVSMISSSDPYTVDFGTSASQPQMQVEQQGRGAEGLLAPRGHIHRAEEEDRAGVGPSKHTERFHTVPPPFLTPALLLSNEAKCGPEKESEMSPHSTWESAEETHSSTKGSTRNCTSEEFKDDTKAAPHFGTNSAPKNAASVSMSNTSALSSFIVFGSGAVVPEPGAPQGSREVPASQMISVGVAATAESPPPLRSSASLPINDIHIREDQAVAHVVRENILTPPVPMVIVDALAGTPLTELLILPSKIPQQAAPYVVLDPNSDEQTALSGVENADPMSLSKVGSDVVPSPARDGQREDVEKSVHNESAPGLNYRNSFSVQQKTKDSIIVRPGLEVDVPHDENDKRQQQHPQASRTESDSGTLPQKEEEDDETPAPTLKSRGRHSLAPPLATSRAPPAVGDAAMAAASKGTLADTHQGYTYQGAELPAGQTMEDGERSSEVDTDTDGENGSSAPSSNRRKRRMRRKTRHRTAVADTIEFEEAGEIEESVLSEDRVNTRNDDGCLSSKTAAASKDPPRCAGLQGHGTMLPATWREIDESFGFPQTRNFQGRMGTVEVSEEAGEEKADSHEQHTTDPVTEESTPLAMDGTDISKKVSSVIEESATGDRKGEEGGAEAVGPEVQLSGGDDNKATNKGAFMVGGFGVIDESTLLVTGTYKNKSKRDGDLMSVSLLEAENMNYKTSTDDRRFISPLSTRSEVKTPYVNNQDVDSYCSTAASAKPLLEERPKSDEANTFHGFRGHPLNKNHVQIAAAFAPARHEAALASPSSSFHQHRHENDRPLRDLMPSLSTSSLSSPHLFGPDGNEVRDAAAQKDREGAEDARETAANSGSSSGDNDNRKGNPASDKEALEIGSHHGSVDETGERRRSSGIGKDEVTLMHERMESVKKSAKDPKATEVSKTYILKVGQGFSEHPDQPLILTESGLLETCSSKKSREMNESPLNEAGCAHAPSADSTTHPALVHSHGSSLRNTNDEAHVAFVDQFVEDSCHTSYPHQDLPFDAMSHRSLDGSPVNVSVAISKTRGTYYGSLDSDVLTPITRRVRAKCWEENEAAALADPDALPRPPTPEFVRSILAIQMKRPLNMQSVLAEKPDEDGETLAVNLPLLHLWDSDRTAIGGAATVPDSLRVTSLTEQRCTSTSLQEESPHASCAMRAGTGVREEFPRCRNANYVKVDDNDEDHCPPHFVAAVPVGNKARALGTRRDTDGATVQHQREQQQIDNTPLSPPAAEDTTRTAAYPCKGVPQRLRFPREAVAETSNTCVAEVNGLIPLKQEDEDVWNSGVPNRFAQLRVRVPSPHPRVLRRNPENNSEESTSASADDDSSTCMTPNVNGTRFMTAVPDGSLCSEELAIAEIQKGAFIRLVDSFSVGSLRSQKSRESAKQF